MATIIPPRQQAPIPPRQQAPIPPRQQAPIPRQTGPVQEMLDPMDAEKTIQKYSDIIGGFVGFFFIGAVVVGALMMYFANKFYKNVSKSQDSLCNQYTCSGAGDCANLPKIPQADGTLKCLGS